MAKKNVTVVKSEEKSSQRMRFFFKDDNEVIPEAKPPEPSPLVKSILNAINDHESKQIQRLGFEADPSQNSEYSAVYKPRLNLIPDTLLKRISIQDDLVASIVNARSNQVGAFGRPQEDRFATGFKIEPRPGVLDKANKDQQDEIQKRIDAAQEKLVTCGETKGWSDKDKLNFAQFLGMQTRNGLVVGRFATEIIYVYDTENGGKKKFHSFRPIDGGTIYRAAPLQEAVESVREQAKALLETMANKKLEKEPKSEKPKLEEFAWIQVIEGRPVQAFTADECVVHNLYPVTDVELKGYPLTPLDTVIAAVTTHINITTHNKMYFQSGRATRGMLVIQSEDVDEAVVKMIRQHFNANINNVNNSWRMPVFQVGANDKVTWQPIDQGQRDMEFQYLSDTNARVILSAFQMSPEELPGYAHLSRGTNNQALSESNNEYKLEAHRDVGIRPLLAQFQDFVNNVLFPLIDPNLAKLCVIKLLGLDADTAEKESIRIQQDAPLHYTMNDILDKVEKESIPKELGGDFPLNPQWQAIVDKYVPVGVILEQFFGMKDASKSPQFQYVRDPFYFQMLQLQIQQQQMQAQAAAGAGGGGGPSDGGGGGGEEGSEKKEKGPPGKEKKEGGGEEGGKGEEGQEGEGGDILHAPDAEPQQDLSTGIDQLLTVLNKSEKQLSPSRRRLLAQQRKMVNSIMEEWFKDAKKTQNEIMDVADKHTPKH